MEWLNSAMPDLLNAAVEYTTDKARGVPDVVLALIIYIMACYMLTVDYPYAPQPGGSAHPPAAAPFF